MQPPTDISSEDLVRMMRAAHKVGDVPGFRSAADTLEQRHRTFIASKAAQKLRPAGLLHLVQDAAHEIFRRLLEDVQAATLRRNMDKVFPLYLNEICRDTLEAFLRREGVQVPTRHKTREGRLPEQTKTVPRHQQVSLNAPIGEDDDSALDNLIDHPLQEAPDDLIMDQVERVERMRSLTPEQRMMVVIYGDYIDRRLKPGEIAARRGISVAEVKRRYTEACRILQMTKERNHE